MGLALIGGLAAAVQVGPGPRRCLASCYEDWRHALCSTAIQSCEGPRGTQQHNSRVGVAERALLDAMEAMQGVVAQRVAQRGGERTC
jgi:hypothetical protein